MTLAILPASSISILETIHHAPQRGTGRGHHSHDAPVCSEIFDVPDYADDDGNEAETGAVAEAEEGGGGEEEGGVGGDEEWEGEGEETDA